MTDQPCDNMHDGNSLVDWNGDGGGGCRSLISEILERVETANEK
jgi:hypothetical protein